MLYEFLDRKLVARYQNALDPWFQPLADLFKLLAKEEIIPKRCQRSPILALPVAWPGCHPHRALYVPLVGIAAHQL
jgi:NADH-quinone oxidoreductase subunit H